MKRIAILAAAALTMASAQAVTAWTLLYTEGDGGTIDSYEAYYCTKAQAKEMFGGNDTYDTISAYLTQDEETYKKGMGELKSGGTALGAYGQYDTKLAFYKYLDSSLSGDFIAVVAKAGGASDEKDRIRVFSASASSGSLTFDPALGKGSAAGWATVPEPTSGLLLLLGVAGLALRRRQK